MKKIVLFFLSLLICDFIMAVPSCCYTRTRRTIRTSSQMGSGSGASGFTAGTHVGFGILNPPVGDALLMQDTGWIRPSIAWENRRLGAGFELSAELGVPFWVTREVWAGIDLDFSCGYEMDLSFTNSLAFILESETFIPVADANATPMNVALDYAFVEGQVSSWLIPSIRFTQELNPVGTLYAQAFIPLYVAGEGDAFSLLGLDFSFFLSTDWGVGMDVYIKSALKNADGEASFFNYVYLTPSYAIGSIYASLGIGIPSYENGMHEEGLSLIPQVQYFFRDNIMAYVMMLVNGLKPSWNPPAFGVGIGFTYRFGG